MTRNQALYSILIILLLGLTLLSAAAQTPATEPFAGWLQAETDHFRFIYEARDQASVAELLTYCEPAYNKVTTLLDSYPEKINCVIRGRQDYTNGFFTINPERMELYTTPPKLPGLKGNWLQLLFTHELTHYVHILYKEGFNSLAGDIFGETVNAALISPFLPGWVIEGITTNTETIFTSGGRGRDYFFEMSYKAPIVEKSLWSLDQAAYSSDFAPQGRIYTAGYILVDYLMQEYGEDVFTRIHKAYLNPLRSFNASVKKVTGKEMELHFRNMQGELTLRYQDSLNMPDGIRLTPREQGNWFLPRITDKGWYIFRYTPEKSGAIVKYDPLTREETPVIQGNFTCPYSFTLPADGSRIVYSSIREEWLPYNLLSAIAELSVYDPATATTKQLTEGGHLWQPALAPDGSRLVAVQRNGSYSRLVEVNQQTGEISLLFAQEKTAVFTPVFSPSGTKVAFVMNVQDLFDIYILDLTEASVLQGEDFPENYQLEKIRPLLGPDDPGDYFPWFPDEDTIIFSSEREGALKLYQCDLDGNNLLRLVEDPVAAFAGLVADNSLIYASYSATGYCLKRPSPEMQSGQLIQAGLPREYPRTPAVTANLPTPEKYLALPLPYLWFPFFNIIPMTDTEGVSLFNYLGYGVNILNANLTTNQSLITDLYYYPGIGQLSGHLGYTFLNGKQTYRYSLSQLYSNTEEKWLQTTTQSLFAGFLLAEKRGLTRYQSLNLNTGLIYAYEQSAAESFTFLHLNDTVATESAHRLSLFNGLSFSSRQYAAPADLYGKGRLLLNLDSLVNFPLLPAQQPDYKVQSVCTWTLPLPGAHHIFKLGAKGGWQSEGAAQSLGIPRGNPAWGGVDTDLHLLINVEYLNALCLLDKGLWGISLRGLGWGFHVEGTAGYIFGSGLEFENALYPGLELSALLGYNTAFVPLTLGINYKIDLNNPLNWDIAQLYPYFAIDVDSFLMSANPRNSLVPAVNFQ